MEVKTNNSQKTDKPWLWVKGQSGNPSGRPKDTLKEHLRKKLQNLTPEEKDAWLLEHNVSGELQFRMAEGNPTEDRNVKISVPTPILGGATAALTVEANDLLADTTTSLSQTAHDTPQEPADT